MVELRFSCRQEAISRANNNFIMSLYPELNAYYRELIHPNAAACPELIDHLRPRDNLEAETFDSLMEAMNFIITCSRGDTAGHLASLADDPRYHVQTTISRESWLFDDWDAHYRNCRYLITPYQRDPLEGGGMVCPGTELVDLLMTDIFVWKIFSYYLAKAGVSKFQPRKAPLNLPH